MRKLVAILLFISLNLNSLFSQGCCDVDTKLVICYTSQDDFCNPAVCDYTFDGGNMQGIRQKLGNPSLFGPNGLSDCEVETIPLSNINSATDIEDLQCDIVFIGTFYTDINDITSTTLSTNFLNSVRTWSMECDENLTILFQGETTAWGYGIDDQNVNPNFPGTAVADLNIFDGAFGSINQFNQGGSFQASFVQTPSTGFTILAEDNLGRPTVVLDEMTNDILLADVGIMCNTAGEVSISPNINNNNDILACNILGLGCAIAGVPTFTEITGYMCEDGSYTLPDGMVVTTTGQYTTTLLSSSECDSVILTNVEFSIPEPFLLSYVGCDQDGFSVEVGGNTYDQSTPTGSEIVQNIYGCDSLVNIELIYHAHSSAVFDTVICVNEPFVYLGVEFGQAIDTTLIIPNANNCDSVINVIVNEFDFANIELDTIIDITNNIPYTFLNQIPGSYDIQWEPSTGLSCDDCSTPILTNEQNENIPNYNLTLVSPDGCVTNYNFQVEYTCTPYIPNIFNPESFSGNEKFGAMVPCSLQDFDLSVFDRWGNLVFESQDQSEFWDGRFLEKKLQPGVYMYQCNFSNQGIPATKVGNITLLK